MASPCGEGMALIGDICMTAPEGYVEARTDCEIAVDSMEAAGVEQDYAAEIAKCREAAGQTDAAAQVQEAAPDMFAPGEFFAALFSGILEWLASIPFPCV